MVFQILQQVLKKKAPLKCCTWKSSPAYRNKGESNSNFSGRLLCRVTTLWWRVLCYSVYMFFRTVPWWETFCLCLSPWQMALICFSRVCDLFNAFYRTQRCSYRAVCSRYPSCLLRVAPFPPLQSLSPVFTSYSKPNCLIFRESLLNSLPSRQKGTWEKHNPQVLCYR